MKELIEVDDHMKILNFLIYLQSIGVVNEEQRINYSNHIQDYLKGRKDNVDVLNQCLSLIVNSN